MLKTLQLGCSGGRFVGQQTMTFPVSATPLALFPFKPPPLHLIIISSSPAGIEQTPTPLPKKNSRLEKKGNYLSNLAPNSGHCSSLENKNHDLHRSPSSSSTKSSMICEVRRASSEEEQQETKRLKKESKVQLACPRCNSSDTKFCYLNNYSAKQPRHFCKGCQRYWTAGGSMRTMAVGAGRRKLKSTASNSFSQTTITFLSPICPNPNICHGFLPAPYWVWIPPMEQRIETLPAAEVLTPKTLRFDDASDAAKSSIWSTLGIKGQSLFGGYKGDFSSNQRFMLANPAALSRSLMFRETTADSEIKLGNN